MPSKRPSTAPSRPALPALPSPSVPLSLALDPLPPPDTPRDSLPSLPMFKKKNRASLPPSDAERFKSMYRSDPPSFAASMTHLPRRGSGTSSYNSGGIGNGSRSSVLLPSPPRPPSPPNFMAPGADFGTDSSNSQNSQGSQGSLGGREPGLGSSKSVASMHEPRRYEYTAYSFAQAQQLGGYQPMRASSAAHARVQRKMARNAAAQSALSLGVVDEYEIPEEERNHRTLAGYGRVGRLARGIKGFFGRSKD